MRFIALAYIMYCSAWVNVTLPMVNGDRCHWLSRCFQKNVNASAMECALANLDNTSVRLPRHTNARSASEICNVGFDYFFVIVPRGTLACNECACPANAFVPVGTAESSPAL